MRSVFLFALASLLFVSCSKNDGSPDPNPDPVIPPQVDTLTTGWQMKKIDASGKDFTDIVFTNATTGFTCGIGKAFYKTADGGTTWQPLAIPIGSDYINLQFLNTQYGFIASTDASPNGGILRTNDGGTTWQLVTNGSQIDVFFVNPAIGFCTNQDGLMKSVDSGKTWVSVPGNFSALKSLWFVNATKGFITSGPRGILKTLDGSTTFTTAVGENYDGYMPVYFTNATNGCAGIGKDVYVTNDGGNNWSLLKQFSGNVTDVKNSGPDEYYVLTRNEIWHSTDSGVNWVREVKLGSVIITELTLNQPGHVWVAGTDGRLYYK